MEQGRIILTGGGTAGHVTPNLAIIPHLQQAGWEVHYIGTHTGIERELIAPLSGVMYHPIQSGKLRRYLDIKNLTDPFRVLIGAAEARRIIRDLAPRVLFSKGGFVAVPVVYGAWLNRVPVVIHESDMTLGLANKLCVPLARTVCTTFPEAAQALGGKAVCTGTPLRPELLHGVRGEGLKHCGFSPEKPVLMMIGGSMGAASVNSVLRAALPRLLTKYQVLHICGKGNLDASLEGTPGYRQFAYLQSELPHAYAAADVLLSRAGSTVISELLALKIPTLLVPYPATASRGDQIDNARSLQRRGLAEVCMQEDLTVDSLIAGVDAVYEKRAQYRQAMAAMTNADGTAGVLAQIERSAK